MRAIVLSAGQGRRLLPLTTNDPKCLLPVDGERPALELQLTALARCGVRHASVVVGFGADRVERFLEERPVPGIEVETLYNPFYRIADNLVSCWLARSAMSEDFVLLNGDTLFEDRVLRRVMRSALPISVTIDRKPRYDDDDMKVSLDANGRLRAIGKRLPPNVVNGESIGMLCFRGEGPATYRDALDRAIRNPDALTHWYLSVVNEMASQVAVKTVSIEGLWWREIDSPEDLAAVREDYRAHRKRDPAERRPLRPAGRAG